MLQRIKLWYLCSCMHLNGFLDSFDCHRREETIEGVAKYKYISKKKKLSMKSNTYQKLQQNSDIIIIFLPWRGAGQPTPHTT
uniref:Uncharacterized protein n=1 Tax=Rhizophora mucronata TaxID=61149 RepID=A0A2P2PPM7_RHIMU